MKKLCVLLLYSMLFWAQLKLDAQEPQRRDRTDSGEPPQSYSVTLNSGLTTNIKRLGITEPLKSSIDNLPVAHIGVGCLIEGGYLIADPRLRGEARIDVFPLDTPEILAGYRFQVLLGYSLYQNLGLSVYPFASVALQNLAVAPDTTARHYALAGGIGVDYALPQSPLIIGIRGSYNYTLPLGLGSFEAMFANAESGAALQVFCGIRIGGDSE